MKRLYLLGLILLVGCPFGNNGSLEVAGQIEGISVDVGSRVGGRVAEVLVDEGDKVEPNAVLVRLQPDEAEATMAAAKAQLAQAQALVDKAERGARVEQIRRAEAAVEAAEEQYLMASRGLREQEIEAARAAAEAARAQRDQAKSEFERANRLLKDGAIAPRLQENAKHALDAAQAQYKAALEQLDAATEGLREEQIAIAKANRDQAQAALDELRAGVRTEDLAAARAARDAALANVQRAQVALDEMVITSPRAGIIESIDVHPGDLVKPGAVVRVTDPDELELYVYVGAAALGHLRLGQDVVLTTDSHGDETFTGKIAYLASEGEFTPRNLQTKEERVQQVFGVKIMLDSAGGKLKAGMTATAHLPLAPENG